MDRQIPYFSHEGDMARMERTNRRLFIIVLVLIAALLGTNGAWLYRESQFEEKTTTVEQEAEWDDGSVIMNGTGEVTINGQGEAKSDDQNQDQEGRRE